MITRIFSLTSRLKSICPRELARGAFAFFGRLVLAFSFSFFFVLSSAHSVSALHYDVNYESYPEQEPVSLCDMAARQVSPFYGVPEYMLRAISFVETGIYHPTFAPRADRLPSSWPWALQVDGKARYFATKQEAVDAANALLKRNIRNFDVGCMQVNMLHHGDAFASMNDAFDPVKNVRYAASYLLNLKKLSGSWSQAMAAYHSKTPSVGQLYRARVQKVIDARL